MYVGNPKMSVCMIRVQCEILNSKLFPKGSSFINLGLSYIKPNKTFDLDKWILRLIPKTLCVFGLIVGLIALTFFDRLPCFDNFFQQFQPMLEYTTVIPRIIEVGQSCSYLSVTLFASSTTVPNFRADAEVFSSLFEILRLSFLLILARPLTQQLQVIVLLTFQ